MYDGGNLLRRLSFILSENSRTPITYWLDLSISELVAWIEINNDLLRERKEILRHK